MNIQHPFGSLRALKTVKDFTGFVQRSAYFDSGITSVDKKGVNPMERGNQVHPMADFNIVPGSKF